MLRGSEVFSFSSAAEDELRTGKGNECLQSWGMWNEPLGRGHLLCLSGLLNVNGWALPPRVLGSWELGKLVKHLGLVISVLTLLSYKSKELSAFSSRSSLAGYLLQWEQQCPQTGQGQEEGQSPQQPQPARVTLLEPSPEG